MNRFSKLYRVMVQASPEFRLDTEALNNMFVRNSDGKMSPVSQYLTLTRVYGAESLTRFNLFSAISVNGAPAEGYSSGQAIAKWQNRHCLQVMVLNSEVCRAKNLLREIPLRWFLLSA